MNPKQKTVIHNTLGFQKLTVILDLPMIKQRHSIFFLGTQDTYINVLRAKVEVM